MDTHGTLSEFGPVFSCAQPRLPDVDGNPCFTNFMRPPDQHEVLSADAEYNEQLDDLATQMTNLSGTDLYPSSSGQGKLHSPIPSGYTYLAQFVTHDTVFTALSSARANTKCDRFHNHRLKALNLDTLYGPHPRVARHAYQVADGGDRFRYKLSIGQMQYDGNQNIQRPAPFRDIGRTAAPGGKELTELCLADTRNDNNAILSQLTALFCILHNGIVDKLDSQLGTIQNSNTYQRRELLFQRARNLVLHVYLDVVQFDLLKRLLTPAVYQYYSDNTGKFLNQEHNKVPLEFSHAVMRCGHSMVRLHYHMGRRFREQQSLRNTIEFNSSNSPFSMPFDQSWIIDWSDFFNMDEQGPRNYARRIDPAYAGDITPTASEPTGLKLSQADLRRSANSGLWSSEALLKVVRSQQENIFGASPLYQRTDDDRKSEMLEWLQAHQISPGRPLDRIADNPPLSFYILYEAMKEQEGKQIGTLGSIIIADVLFAAISQRRAELVPANVEKDLQAVFGNCTKQIFDMPTLIEAMSSFVDTADGSLPFYS